MTRPIDVTTALYGLQYDLGEMLKKQNGKATMKWLESRVVKLRRDIEYWESEKASQRKGGREVGAVVQV